MKRDREDGSRNREERQSLAGKGLWKLEESQENTITACQSQLQDLRLVRVFSPCPKPQRKALSTVCPTGQDSGQDNSEAHEDEACDLSEKRLLCVSTLGPQAVLLFGKVCKLRKRVLPEEACHWGWALKCYSPPYFMPPPLLPTYQSRCPCHQAFPHGRHCLEQHVLENSLGQISC